MESDCYDFVGENESGLLEMVFGRMETEVEALKPTTESCIMCTFLMKVLEIELRSKTLKEELDVTITEICKKMHPKVKIQCDTFVKQFDPNLIRKLQATFEPKSACAHINACPKSSQAVIMRNIDEGSQNESDNELSNMETEIIISTNIQKKGKPYCLVCKAVVEASKHLIKTDYSKGHIKHVLSSICNKLKKFGNKCNNFVNQHMGRLVDMLADATKRNQACRFVGVCSTHDNDEEYDDVDDDALLVNVDDDDSLVNVDDDASLVSAISDENVGIGECFVCKAVVKAVKEIVKHSFTKDKIQHALRKACQKVHSNHCTSFVNKHFNKLVDLLAAGSSRGKVCRLLLVCSVQDDLENSEENQLSTDMENEIIPSTNIQKKGKPYCLVCKAVVEASKHLIKTDYSKDHIKHVLSRICNKLKKFGNKCNNFVNQHMGRLVDMLADATKRNQACRFVGVCSTHDNDEEYDDVDDDNSLVNVDDDAPLVNDDDDDASLVNVISDENVGIGECFVCKAVVKAVKEIVKHSFTKDKIQHALRKACQKVHSNHCTSFVNKHFNKLVDLLAAGSSRGKVCRLLLVCSVQDDLENSEENQLSTDMENEIIPSTNIQKKGKPYCLVCKAVVEASKHLIKTDYSKDHIKHVLSRICNKLKKFGNKCNNFVNQHMGRLVDMLADATKRNQACRFVGVCSTHENDEEYDDVDDDNSLVNVDDDASLVNVDDDAPLVNDDDDASLVNAISDENVGIGECFVCKAVVKAVKEIVKHSFTKDKIQHALRKACQKVHSNHCTSFVNKHFNKLVDLLAAGSSRGKVCRLLLVCSVQDDLENAQENQLVDSQNESEDNELTDMENEIIPSINIQKKGKPYCLVCKAVVEASKHLIKTDYSKGHIKHVLSSICNKIKKFGNKCNNFVNQHMDRLVDMLADTTKRNQACRFVGVCSTHDNDEEYDDDNDEEYDDDNDEEYDVEDASLVKVDDDVSLVSAISDENVGIGECFVCKAVVKAVKEIVKHSFTRDKIQHALRKACQKVHSNHCTSFVNKHFNQMVDLLAAGSSRGKVCRLLLVCSVQGDFENSQEYQLSSEMITSNNVQKKGKPYCLVCKAVVEASKHLIKTDYSKDHIKHVLSSICNKLKKFGNKCNNFVNQHMGRLVDMLADATKRNQACRFVGVCSTHENDEEYDDVDDEASLVNVDDDAPLVNDDVDDEASLVNVDDDAPLVNDDDNDNASLVNAISDENVGIEDQESFSQQLLDLTESRQNLCNFFITKTSNLLLLETWKNQTYKQLVCQSLDSPNVFCENNFEAPLARRVITRLIQSELPVCDNSLSQEVVDESALCDSCNFILLLLRQVFQNKNITSMVDHEIHYLCTLAPDFLKPLCLNEGKTLWQQLSHTLKTLNVKATCHAMWMC